MLRSALSSWSAGHGRDMLEVMAEVPFPGPEDSVLLKQSSAI